MDAMMGCRCDDDGDDNVDDDDDAMWMRVWMLM